MTASKPAESGHRPDVAIFDYGMGNLHSVAKGLERAGAMTRLVTSPEDLGAPQGVVLPGVGNFGRCAENLRASRLDFAVFEWLETGKPFLGICVGMQLLYARSEESHEAGLDILEGSVRRIPRSVRVPHMGWNTLSIDAPPESGSMFAGFEPAPWLYFVHSFAADGPSAGWRGSVLARCTYGTEFVAAVECGNLWATQFHPEKSGPAGLALLSNFVSRCEA